MYAFINLKQPAGARKTTFAQLLRTVFWAAALPPLAGAVLVGGLAALAGLPPLDIALDFLGKACVELSGPIADLCLIVFFVSALYYGVSPVLPGQLLHRTLTAGIAARFTLLCALWTPHQDGGATLSANRHSALAALTRPSRVALCTAADLAGSAPRLE